MRARCSAGREVQRRGGAGLGHGTRMTAAGLHWARLLMGEQSRAPSPARLDVCRARRGGHGRRRGMRFFFFFLYNSDRFLFFLVFSVFFFPRFFLPHFFFYFSFRIFLFFCFLIRTYTNFIYTYTNFAYVYTTLYVCSFICTYTNFVYIRI